eukprot:m.230167 g.230167  ORF g.230167 m.230167 type:complete len:423 (+) comp17058_c4_seq1:388-1656(+)
MTRVTSCLHDMGYLTCKSCRSTLGYRQSVFFFLSFFKKKQTKRMSGEDHIVQSSSLAHHGQSLDSLWADDDMAQQLAAADQMSVPIALKGTKRSGRGGKRAVRKTQSAPQQKGGNIDPAGEDEDDGNAYSTKRSKAAPARSQSSPQYQTHQQPQAQLHRGQSQYSMTTRSAATSRVDSDVTVLDSDGSDEELDYKRLGRLAPHELARVHALTMQLSQPTSITLQARATLMAASHSTEVMVVPDKQTLPEKFQVQVRTERSSKAFDFTKDQSFETLFEELKRALRPQPFQHISVTYNGEVVHPTDTPDLLDMKPSHLVLDVKVIDKLDEEIGVDSVLVEEDKTPCVPVQMRANDGKTTIEATYSIEATAKFEGLMQQFAELCNAPLSSLKFRFDGDNITASSTPQSLDMEPDDTNIVDVFISK